MDTIDEVRWQGKDPVGILQKLVRFNTTNPPGNEAACVEYVHQLLRQAGIDARILAKSPSRPNLVARLPGLETAPPLLLYGHVDVVTTENQDWQHPPFEGRLEGGYIWGRGTLDMKGGVAMLLSAFLRAKAAGFLPAGDIILAIVSDEEAGGDFGARWLVEEHPGVFKDVRYALGEFGGFTMTIGKKCFYPIQVSEKQMCWMVITAHGPGGHGSVPVHGGAMAKLARVLTRLDSSCLPVHVTPPARMMFSKIASGLGGISGTMLRQLLNPSLTNSVLKILGDRGRLFSPLFHNTASPTVLHGGSKVNVIPGEVSVEVDGRLLPGFRPEDMLSELRRLVGDEVDIEVIRSDPGPAEPDMGLFDLLGDILVEADPGTVPVPLLLSGVTDGRFFSRLGIQTYGFTPMQLPSDFNFVETIHAANERIPVDALEFGTQAIIKAIQRYGSREG